MSETSIRIKNNGPLLVEGAFRVVDADGGAFGLSGRSTIALCRCGHSENKPFCDGAHNRAGFQSVCTARDLPAPVPKS